MTALIATSEGAKRRFEVIQSIDGYTVRATDLATGLVEGSAETLFRTAPAAFAFAELVASSDRLSRRVAAMPTTCSTRHWRTMSASSASRKCAGCSATRACHAGTLEAWEEAEATAARMRYH